MTDKCKESQIGVLRTYPTFRYRNILFWIGLFTYGSTPSDPTAAV